MTEKRRIKKVKAQEKVKKHIDKRGHVAPFIVTPSIVLKWWHILNNAIFEGKLRPPKTIICRNFHDSHGWCQGVHLKDGGRTVRMGIRTTQPSRKLFLIILAHEMVHQWQFVFKERMGHGKSFKKWKPMFEQTIGIPLDSHIDHLL